MSDPGAVELTDGVITLRPPTEGDVDSVLEACQDPEIQRWTTVPSPYRRSDAAAYVDLSRWAWAQGDAAVFVIVDSHERCLLGTIDMRHVGAAAGEIGYWVAPWARRRGVAGRALTLVRDWAGSVQGKTELTLQVFDGNEGSAQVAERAGFRRVGTVTADHRGEARVAHRYSWMGGTGSGGDAIGPADAGEGPTLRGTEPS